MLIFNSSHDEQASVAVDRDETKCDCESDPIACLENMFVEQVQRRRIDAGQTPARRPVFVRTHGVARGEFVVEPDLPEDLRIGIFGQAPTYPAWVRFSTDPFGMPDYKSTVGIAIKLFDIVGEKMLSPDESATTADFLMQNIDVFFVDNARDMCSFTKASLSSEEAGNVWLNEHPDTKAILDAMQKVVPSALGSEFWSVIPFRFGEHRFCKYKLEPEVLLNDWMGDYDDPNYLQADLVARLRDGESRFRFLVQFSVDETRTPLDKATVSWTEEDSRPIHVATLVLPRQDLSTRGQSDYGEALSFNPWRTLAVHEPIGSIAAARKIVYRASARLRRNVNGQPIGEPAEARPMAAYPKARDTRIVRAAIHPAIGIARVGNSREPGEDGYYIGPEVTDPPPTEPGRLRDKYGAIRRQAARFRIFGYNLAGEVVGELNNASSVAPTITWTVHPANKKAQWYQFQAALDIPEQAAASVPRRNPTVTGAERESLIIDPGSRSIEAGASLAGPKYQFDTGTFRGVKVPLGELQTDPAGRLIFLGGYGVSDSPEGKPIYIQEVPTSFNNADGWFDDISDGPVSATLQIDGRDIPVEPAWVVVAPPNFAPDVIGWRTLHDLMEETFQLDGRLSYSNEVSFTRDIAPVLRRLSNLQWVNKGFASFFGANGSLDFNDPALIAKLAYRPEVLSPRSDVYKELRQQVYNAFRRADDSINNRIAWPWIYGDAYGGDSETAAGTNLSLSDKRSSQLKQWVIGEFKSDWNPAAPYAHNIDDVPVAEQPDLLDKAALHFCLADAFHPGCEMTWPMRHSSMYSAPFRIRHRASESLEPDYGDTLMATAALLPGGPLYAQGPGDISRWMAIPWQGDTAFCKSGYDMDYDPYLPTFWPARVPNQVLTETDYKLVIDKDHPIGERIAAFANREHWVRFLTGSAPQKMLQMVHNFGEMGILESRAGAENDQAFPSTFLVEGLPQRAAEQSAVLLARKELTEKDESSIGSSANAETRRLREAGWESREQLEEACRLRGFRRPRERQ